MPELAGGPFLFVVIRSNYRRPEWSSDDKSLTFGGSRAEMPDSSAPAPNELPLLVFDGDCRFCRTVVDRWQAALGPQVQFVPYQQVRERYPQISEHDFNRAVHLVGAYGKVTRGAEAVFGAMAYCGRKRWLLWLYQRLPPFALVSEVLYRLVAANRGPLTLIRRIWYGRDLNLPTYHISSTLFLRLLGLIYLIAFVSLWTQIDGLVGDHGILPVNNYLEGTAGYYSHDSPPESPVWHVPTLAWISPHDGFLHVLCAAGTVLSIMLLLGLLPLPALIFLWLDYLSLFHAGQVFLGFQWDILLLETGFVAIFLAPFVLRSRLFADRHPPRLAVFLVWWLLFRLMLESGAVKLTWIVGQPHEGGVPVANTWTALTALDFHYWTQPLPIWTSWYAAKLPEWFQKLSIVFLFVVELGTPLLIFGPRKLRYVAWGAITLLMLLIAGTGNYNFFNLLTIALALTLLDDRAWPRFLQRRIRGTDWPVLASPTRWRSIFLFPFAAFAVLVGALQVQQAVAPSARPDIADELQASLAQFFLVDDYGLFRRMTETRPEILIEGGPDGMSWKPYEFRWKPGDLATAPRFCTPHQPRLDWQMWFEALRLEFVFARTNTIDPRNMDPWFQSFLMQLLKGEPAVVGLLAKNPFPTAPPKFIRISLYQFRFTTWDEWRQTHDWWHREPVWVGPALSLAH